MTKTSTELFDELEQAIDREATNSLLDGIRIECFDDFEVVLFNELYEEEFEARHKQGKLIKKISTLIEEAVDDDIIRVLDQPDIEPRLVEIEQAIASVRARFEERAL